MIVKRSNIFCGLICCVFFVNGIVARYSDSEDQKFDLKGPPINPMYVPVYMMPVPNYGYPVPYPPYGGYPSYPPPFLQYPGAFSGGEQMNYVGRQTPYSGRDIYSQNPFFSTRLPGPPGPPGPPAPPVFPSTYSQYVSVDSQTPSHPSNAKSQNPFFLAHQPTPPPPTTPSTVTHYRAPTAEEYPIVDTYSYIPPDD